MGRGKDWSTQEIKTLLAMKKSGHSSQEISEVLNRPVKGVDTKYKRLQNGIANERTEERRFAGKEKPKVYRNYRRDWSPVDEGTAITLFLHGSTPEQIGKQLGRPTDAVANKLSKLGAYKLKRAQSLTKSDKVIRGKVVPQKRGIFSRLRDRLWKVTQ